VRLSLCFHSVSVTTASAAFRLPPMSHVSCLHHHGGIVQGIVDRGQPSIEFECAFHITDKDTPDAGTGIIPAGSDGAAAGGVQKEKI